jgi:hypothetical protein
MSPHPILVPAMQEVMMAAKRTNAVAVGSLQRDQDDERMQFWFGQPVNRLLQK